MNFKVHLDYNLIYAFVNPGVFPRVIPALSLIHWHCWGCGLDAGATWVHTNWLYIVYVYIDSCIWWIVWHLCKVVEMKNYQDQLSLPQTEHDVAQMECSYGNRRRMHKYMFQATQPSTSYCFIYMRNSISTNKIILCMCMKGNHFACRYWTIFVISVPLFRPGT